MLIRNAHSNILISGACSAEVKTEGVRHGSPMKEAEHGEECEDEGEGEPRAGEEAEHGEECADESEGEVEDGGRTEVRMKLAADGRS